MINTETSVSHGRFRQFLGAALTLHIIGLLLVQIIYPAPFQGPQKDGVIVMGQIDRLPSDLQASTTFWRMMREPSRLIILPGRIAPTTSWTMPSDPVFDQPARAPVNTIPLPNSPSYISLQRTGLADEAEAANKPAPLLFRYPEPKPQKDKVKIQLNSELQSLLNGPLPVLAMPEIQLLTEAHVTHLRLGINHYGKVDHVLVESSSGSGETDQAAVQAARQIRFKPLLHETDNPSTSLRWGTATVFWVFQ